jgi:hypothetical protein
MKDKQKGVKKAYHIFVVDLLRTVDWVAQRSEKFECMI